MTASLLFFGFLLGLQHAVEADHVAAVATLASRSASLRDHVTLAGLWGIGHAAAVLAFGMAVVALGLAVPPALTEWLDGVVGLVLIVLGIDVLCRLRRRRVHFHVHRHDDGAMHFHAHSHAGESVHDARHHDHLHPRGLARRALAVGGLHGIAGSAALVVVTAESTRSVPLTLAYLSSFGVGTIAGMMTLSLVIAVPFRGTAGDLGRFQHGLQAALGTATMALGAWIAVHSLLGE